MSNMSSSNDKVITDDEKVKLIIGEVGRDTKTGIIGRGYSFDNGVTFHVTDTIHGRLYDQSDTDGIWNNGLHDKVEEKVSQEIINTVEPAIKQADNAVKFANDAIEKSKVNENSIREINSAVSDAISDAAVAKSDGLRAWDIAQKNANLIDSNYASASAAIDQNKKLIALKANQATVDTLSGKVSQNAATLTTQANLISSKVTSSDVQNLLNSGGYVTQEYTQTLVKQTADNWNLNLNNVKSSLTQSVTNLNASIDGIKADVYNKDGSSKVVQLSNLIATKVSSGDYNSQITQLKNDINLRVQKGGLLSQINLEAGRALIKSGNVVLSGDTVTFDTKEAFIPAAAISKLTADDISTGTLKGVKVDFRNSTGTGMIADGSTLTFDVSNTPAGDLSYNGMPVAEIPDGSGGNELAIRYGLSTAIIPNDNSEAQATFSKAAQKIAYMTGTDRGKQMLSGLEVHSNNHHWLGAVNSDATYNRLEINNNDGVNLTWHDQTHFWISDGKAKLYKDCNDSSTATKLEIHGWAWINGWCEAAGHSTHSTLSSKTDIRDFDTAEALKLIDETQLMTFRYKNEKDSGVLYDHYGPIIDDVHDVLKYQMPEAFISPTRTARDDSNIVGALMGAVQELHKQVKELQKKIGTTS